MTRGTLSKDGEKKKISIPYKEKMSSSSESSDISDSELSSSYSESEELEILESYDNSSIINKRKNITPEEEEYELLEPNINLAELSDSSDTEGHKNRIGNVPLEFYADEDHIGYNIEGKPIARKSKQDAIDNWLNNLDASKNPTVYDEINDEYIEISKEDVDLIRNIRKGKIAHAGQINEYPDYVPYYTKNVEMNSLHNDQLPKRRFIPSKIEAKLILRYVNAIKNGWLKTSKEKEEELQNKNKELNFDIWQNNDNENSRYDKHGPPKIPAPKKVLPGHAESYNPPSEYLPTENELNEWDEMDEQDRPYNFIPQKYKYMRHIPAYDKLLKDSYERCLDLYLCPRIRRKKLNIDPESLIPKLPSAKSLKPFPTYKSIEYIGHTKLIRTLDISPCGQYLVTGSDDKTVRIYEISTGRCFGVFYFDDIITLVQYNPNKKFLL